MFYLNGKEIVLDEDINLLDYLRDYANLTSVKNGCKEGSCGACTVIVDGKAQRACLMSTKKVDGKSVLTVEGLSEFEKDVYSYSFTSAGAVQCGFCTPGMIMSAKTLLDRNPEPTVSEIKIALKGNICRCTGYVKIIEAVLLAAKFLRDKKLMIEENEFGKVGDRLSRVDVKEKILGSAIYTDDLKVEGMLYGTALRTKYPRALIKSIDISIALEHPDVVTILLADDIPGERNCGHLVKDWPALISCGEETRYIGDALALVASKKKTSLKDICDLIKVDYEVLEPITSPHLALKDDAPKIHPNGNILRIEHVNRGDVDSAFKDSPFVVTNTYVTPFTEHAFLEPESALAIYENEGVTIYTGSQSVYDEQREIASLLNLPKDKVRCVSKYVGGAFGGKEDMSVQHHAALLAYVTKQPVKITLSRKESILVHPKRHAMEISVTTSCDKEGNLTGFKARIISDTGAYASLGGPVLQRACTHAAGPYRCPNVDIEGKAIYTNNPPGGAFRGFGVTQSVFASECNLNQLADLVGITPWEIRFKNAVLPNDILPNGQIAHENTAIRETLLSVKEDYDKHKYVGIACAMKNAGLGVGVKDVGRCTISINDGFIHIRTSAACVGQGLGTILTQIVSETTNINANMIKIDAPDTFRTPDSGTSTASRQTLFTGEATRLAALKLKERLEKKQLIDLNGEEFYGEYEGVTDPLNSMKEHPISHVAYSYATQLVIIDDTGKLVLVVAAHDVGVAINPTNIEGQIEGGVVMGLGYALTEDFPLNGGYPLAKFGTLGLFRTTDIPEIKTIIIEKNTSQLAYGAKGIGEITTIPTAPAVQGAYYRLDKVMRTKLPLENTLYRRIK